MRLSKLLLLLLLIAFLVPLSGEAIGNGKGTVGLNVGRIWIRGDTPEHGYGYTISPYFHYPLLKVSKFQLGMGLMGGYASVSGDVDYTTGIALLQAYPFFSLPLWKGSALYIYPFEVGICRWNSKRGATKFDGWDGGFGSRVELAIPLKGPWGFSISGKVREFTTDKLDTRVGGEWKDGSRQAMLGLSYNFGYARMASKQDLARLEEARKAAESAEITLREKQAEKAKLEAELSARESELKRLEAKRDATEECPKK